MNRMSATFQFEGHLLGPSMDEVGVVSITLETDGQFVRIVERPELSRWSPPLTPKGWAALSQKANDLMGRANNQWDGMGAER